MDGKVREWGYLGALKAGEEEFSFVVDVGHFDAGFGSMETCE